MIILNDNSEYSNIVLVFSLSLVFMVLASPYSFKKSNTVVYSNTSLMTAEEGRPYAFGILLHSLLFFLFAFSIVTNNYILFIIMLFACLIL
jgi:hypothetical protein